MSDIRNEGHWVHDNFSQRITAKEYKEMLLNGQDRIVFNGKVRQMMARKLGFGVVEIYKCPE